MKIQYGKLIISSSNDERYSNYICLYLLIFTINLFIKNGLDITSSTVDFFMRAVLATYLAYAFIKSSQKFIFIYIITTLIVSCFFVKSYCLGNVDANLLISNYISVITIYIPLFACAYMIRSKDILLEKLTSIEYCVVIILLTSFTLIRYSLNGIHSYDSSSAYVLCVIAFGLYIKYIKCQRILFCITSLLLCCIAFTFGSRGTLICIVGFFLMQTFVKKEITFKRLVFSSLIILGTCFIMFNINNIISLIPGNLETRNISILTQTNSYVSGMADSNGRIKLWAYYWEVACESPIIGVGIFGKYLALYPHNIFIEIFAAEGFVLGGILTILLLYKQVKPISCLKKGDANSALYIIFSVGFFEVLFSTDFILNELWWLFTGICFSVKKNVKLN